MLAVFSGHIYLLRESGEPVSEALDAMEKALENAERLARNLAEAGIQQAITAVLGGYVTDQSNPFVRDAEKTLAALVKLG